MNDRVALSVIGLASALVVGTRLLEFGKLVAERRRGATHSDLNGARFGPS